MTEKSTLRPLAITQGDPAGIGPENVAMAYRDAPELLRGCFAVGDLATLRRAAQCIVRPGQPELPVAQIDAPVQAPGRFRDPLHVSERRCASRSRACRRAISVPRSSPADVLRDRQLLAARSFAWAALSVRDLALKPLMFKPLPRTVTLISDAADVVTCGRAVGVLARVAAYGPVWVLQS